MLARWQNITGKCELIIKFKNTKFQTKRITTYETFNKWKKRL